MAKLTPVTVIRAGYVPAVTEARYHLELTEDEALAVARVLGRHRSTAYCDTFGVYRGLTKELGSAKYNAYASKVDKLDADAKAKANGGYYMSTW